MNDYNFDDSSLIEDSRQLIENILSESQPEHKYILAIVAKADRPGIIYPESNSLFPNFYGYSMDRTKMYLMTDLKVTSNVPRQGSEIRIMNAPDLVLCEKRLNLHYNSKTLDDLLFETSSAKWAWTQNTSKYQNAEVILVFREKALEFLNLKKRELQENIPVPSQEYILTNSNLIESLQFKFNNLKNLPEKGFFLGIADYVKFIDENSGFEQTLLAIDEFKKRDCAKLMQFEKKLLEDINKVEKIVIDRVKNERIESEIISKCMNDLEKIKDGRIQSKASKTEELYDGLSYFISILHENGYGNFISDFIKLSKSGSAIEEIMISDYYYPFIIELNEYKTKIQKTIWGSWSELVVAYIIVHKYREQIQELIEKKDILGRLKYSNLYNEMGNILGNVNNDRRRLHFDMNDYISHINRVHDFIVNKLKSETIIKQRTGSEILNNHINEHEQFNDWQDKFNWIDDRRFYLDEGKIISFNSKNSDRIKVFKALTEAKGQFVNLSKLAMDILGKSNNTNHHNVRVIIGQLNKEKCEKHNLIQIVPLGDTELGAYRIKVLHNPL